MSNGLQCGNPLIPLRMRNRSSKRRNGETKWANQTKASATRKKATSIETHRQKHIINQLCGYCLHCSSYMLQFSNKQSFQWKLNLNKARCFNNKLVDISIANRLCIALLMTIVTRYSAHYQYSQ